MEVNAFSVFVLVCDSMGVSYNDAYDAWECCGAKAGFYPDFPRSERRRLECLTRQARRICARLFNYDAIQSMRRNGCAI